MLVSRSIPLFLLLIVIPICSLASPFVPERGEFVLEKVEKHTSADLEEIADLVEKVRKSPLDINLTVLLFNKYLDQARITGDPFYSGMAEATLQPWIEKKNIPHPIRLARAMIKQHNHDFISAEKDLNHILSKKPHDVQARLLRANIFRVQGKYNKAREDCFSLTLLTDPLVVTICSLSLSSLTGKAEWAADKLESILKDNTSRLAGDLKGWATLVLAEALNITGQNKKALLHLRKIVAPLQGSDIYSQANYMDFLLSEKRYQEAYSFASDQKLPDAILIRKAIAAKKLNIPDAEKLAAVIKSRFSDNERAGRTQHLREQALYELHLNENAEKALELSIKNWEKQRELLDTRIVLESALNAGKPKEALTVIKWIKRQGTEDIYIRRLISELKGQ